RAPDPHGLQPVVSQRPRNHVVRGGMCLQSRAAGTTAVPRGHRVRPQPPLPGCALPQRCPGRRRAGQCPRRSVAAVKVGIVGLPNAGKSSLFTALTGVAAEAANYPFTTIEPNMAIVPVVDERLDTVAAIVGASKIVP